jgi:ribose transport system substrate-binding protein
MRRRVVATAMAAAAALGSVAPVGAAPGGNGHGAQFRLAWLANDPANQYDNAIRAGIEEEAARAHATVDAFFAGFDPGVQLAQCDAALDSGVYSALLIIAADPIAIIPCVEAAHAAGVPVAAVDLPIGPDQTIVEPQVPGVVAASLIPAGEWGTAVSAMTPNVCAGLAPCNVFYLAGLLAFPVDQFGLAAATAVADQSPSVNLAGYAEAYYDTGFAREVFAAALEADAAINAVIASGDQMALGAEQAAAAAGRSVRIVGAGAGVSALDAVRNGRWHATFNTLPRTEGRLAAELLVRALRARPTAPAGVNPVANAGLPAWWTQATLATHPDFAGEWPGP